MSTLIVPSSPMIFTDYGREWADRILRMSGSVANYASQKLGDLLLGATPYSAESPYYIGLWTAALTSAFNGATASEVTTGAYGAYARLSFANNTTHFTGGSGSTSYVKNWPSDTTYSFATSTGGTGATVTYMGVLQGNAGTSADKGIMWCSVTNTTINLGDTPQLATNAITVTFGS